MERIPGWLLPFALAVIQLALWPGRPLARGDHLSAVAVATGVAATLVVAVAMLWRRSAPVAVIAIVAGAITVGTWSVPEDALLLVSSADLIVLFTVAVRHTARTTAVVAAAVTAWQCVLVTLTGGLSLDGDFAGEVGTTVVVYATVVAFGRARHRWHAERSTAAARLAEAEDRRARAADTERHRLARELHDVTAHHLTSIVVIASAAQRLGDSRPDLVADARAFAARTGRDTLAALHRLVALLQLPDERPGPGTAGPAPVHPATAGPVTGVPAAGPAARLAQLAEGFGLLGQDVSVQAEPADLPPAVTEAICGITREALTNTLRYAPAAAVRIRLTPTAGGDLELTVDDDGARADEVESMGSGRGVAGMRERATALGGTLDAGPRPGGGWRVRAVLPRTGDPAPVPRRRRPGAEHIIDVTVFLLALFMPVGGLLASGGDPDVAASPIALLILVAALHCVPLLWRRTRPWTALAVVAATAWIVPALIGAGVVAPAMGWVMLAGLGAEAAAVYAVARYARRGDLSALAIPLALSSAILATGVTLALDPPEEGIPTAVWVLMMATVVGCPLGVPIVGAWLTGYLIRRRGTRILAQEHDAVAASTAQAIAEAHAERARVAAGLRAAVLRDTAQVATAADHGDLDQVLASARAALDAMRGLLNGLRDEPDPARADNERDPQPTTAALPGLADRWRAGGRQVALVVLGAGRSLPADLDLSAFRVVELLLAGDTGPVAVGVDLTGDPLRITVRPMPGDEGGELAAGLRARLAAVGGSMAAGADGLPEILLPAPRPADPDVKRPLVPPNDENDPAGPAGRAGTDAPGTTAVGDEPVGNDKEVASSPSG